MSTKRQNVGLETGWRQIGTSQTAHTKYKWLPYATEWTTPHENFLRTPLPEADKISLLSSIFSSLWRACDKINESLMILLKA